MKKRIYRKRHHIRHNSRDHSKNRIGLIFISICCSVIAGFLTSNYIIGPALGLDTDIVISEFINKKQSVEIDNKKVVDESDEKNIVVEDQIIENSESGYAVQYGSFSSKERAQKFMNELTSEGIDASIYNKDGSYKIIGKVFDTKEEARVQKNNLNIGKDVFITEIP